MIRRCSSLPFVKKDDLDEAMDIFNKRAENLENEDLQEFSYRLIEYLNSQWRQGVFAVQDWNLYNLNLLLVPTTNNGNEGQNRRFKESIHEEKTGKVWSFAKPGGKPPTKFIGSFPLYPRKKIHDTVAGGSVLASGAQPPASVVNFFLILKVAHTSLGAVKLLYGCTLFQPLYSCTLSCSVMYSRTLFNPLYTCSCSWAVEV